MPRRRAHTIPHLRLSHGGTHAAAAGLLAACAGLLAGCATEAPPPAAPATAPTRVSTAEPPVSPVVVGGDEGLELQWWVVAGRDAVLARTLAPYLARPVPLSEDDAAMFAANGLRLIAVPVDALDALRREPPVVGAVQRQWLGQAPEWIDAVGGPVYPGGIPLRLHDGTVRLDPGRIRLLARCWTVPRPPSQPGAPARAALHLQLLPQHMDLAARAGEPDPLSPTPTRPIDDQGLAFTRLLMRLDLAAGEAYLLVPCTPAADWSRLASAPAEPPPPAPAPESSTQAPAIGRVTRAPSPDAEGGGGSGGSGGSGGVLGEGPATGPQPSELGIGPPASTLRSVGEVMLTSVGPGSLETAGGTRPSSAGAQPADKPLSAVLIFVPRVPPRFHLSGR